MKILYIAHERRSAQLAAHALRVIAPNVTLAWAQSPGAGKRWLEEHRDAGAVIVERDGQGETCVPLIEHVRSLGLSTPVAVVAPEQLAQLLGALKASLQTMLQQELTKVDAARQEAEERRTSEAAAAAARLAELQEQHNASLARATRICATLQERLIESEAALRGAEERRAAEAAAFADQLAQRHSAFTAGLTQAARSRDALAQQLSAATAGLEDARQARSADAAAAADRLARRESELQAALTEAAAARTAVERALADTETARRRIEQQATTDLAEAADRHGALETRLASEAGARKALERELADTRMASAHARQRLLDIASAIRRRARAHKARFDTTLQAERLERERDNRARDERTAQVERERDTLQQAIAAARAELQQLQSALEDEREAHAHARSKSEAGLQRLAAERDQLRQSLDQLGAAFRTLEQAAGEHAIERARLESVVAERDADLAAQAARAAASEQAARDARAEGETLRQALESARSDAARRQQELDGLGRDLEALRSRADALQHEAGRVPVLQAALDESQRENRRQFERAPYALCRCTPDGIVTHANHSLVRMLRYRRAEEILGVDFASVFECPGDLRWAIERAASTGTTQAVDTTWTTRDGQRLSVRLHALTTGAGEIVVAAEDVTTLRAVEHRLRRAQKMEAVGRLASEVAGTCETLLRDTAEDGRHWLAAMGDTPIRQQGERLLGEVTRAAGFLRQLAVYGTEQARALEPASVQRVLRDLEPVLKRVAGGDIELLLPKTSAPFVVDVEAERVERILVNVASYARGRMPNCGRVKIDLGTTVVDSRFIAKYPGVRPGPHVLITITEVPGDPGAAWPAELATERPAAATAKPGVDLGALLGLVGDCGGHLWMEAEPSGTLTLKIRLPKPASEPGDRAAAERAHPGRPLARWLRSSRSKVPSGITTA